MWEYIRRRLVEYFEREEAVSVSNCEVKKSCYMDKLELILKKDTEITKAEKVVKIDCNHNEVKHSDTDVVDVGMNWLCTNVLQLN